MYLTGTLELHHRQPNRQQSHRHRQEEGLGGRHRRRRHRRLRHRHRRHLRLRHRHRQEEGLVGHRRRQEEGLVEPIQCRTRLVFHRFPHLRTLVHRRPVRHRTPQRRVRVRLDGRDWVGVGQVEVRQ